MALDPRSALGTSMEGVVSAEPHGADFYTTANLRKSGRR